MDWVSSLLEQAHLTASIDIWCRLPAGARLIPDAPPGAAAPFHLLIDGRCSVHTEDGVVELHAGDFLLLPRGKRHEVRFTETTETQADWIPRYPLIAVAVSRARRSSAARPTPIRSAGTTRLKWGRDTCSW